MTADAVLAEVADSVGRTSFVGYDRLQVDQAPVLAIVENGKIVDEVEEGSMCKIVLSSTPFYAESGGQIGDRGVMEVCRTLYALSWPRAR